MAIIRAEIPVYLGLIADGRIDVPVRTFPLPAIGDAWLAAASSGSRAVVLPNAVSRLSLRHRPYPTAGRSFQNGTLVT